MSEGRGAGSGKVILLGEHAVVHGQPAIAAGLGYGVRVVARSQAAGVAGGPPGELRAALEAAAAAVGGVKVESVSVTIEGDLPVAMGLGSSAALSVALVRAFADFTGRSLDEDSTARAANEVERVFHGTPSGIDANTATRGGLLWFEAGPPPLAEPLRPPAALPIVVALSGTRHHTGQTVGGLRERAEALPEVYEPVFAAIGDLVRAGRGAIERGDWGRLGAVMSMNHELLRACGVSTGELDRLVAKARSCGALGAKLTGAGGGGAAVALADGDPAALAGRLKESGWESFVA